MRLSEHFRLSEFTLSQTALRKGIPNRPDTEALANMKTLCQKTLEPVRKLLGHPIYITSGYRSPALNGAIGGSKKSQHIEGKAADFICPNFGTPREIAEIISVTNIDFDQMIWEGDWVHISYDAGPRSQILTAQFTDEGVVYHPGLT
jgi:hypothetical protein